MYADAFGLFVFGAFFTSVSLSKNDFFDRLNGGKSPPFLFIKEGGETFGKLPSDC